MGTFNHKETIDVIIANNGYYSDDPQVIRIVEYTNFGGRICWGVVYITEPMHMWDRYDYSTDYIINPKVIWTTIADPAKF